MLYNEHMGKIYDTIYFGQLYFCKPAIIKRFEDLSLNLEGAFSFYEEVRNSCPSLLKCLYPFFYFDGIAPTVLSEYMRQNIDFHVHTMNDYLRVISDKTKLKKLTFDHLFSNLSDSDREKLMNRDSAVVFNAFENKPWPPEMVEQTTLLLHHFSYVADKLYDTLSEIYKHIDNLHKKYNNIISQRIEETTEKEVLLLLEKIYALNENTANKQIFSLCFMNQYIYWNENSGRNESVFIFGNRFKESLYNVCNKRPSSAEKVLYILGDPIRFNIINLLRTHKLLTQSDISRLANIASSTAFSSTSILFEETIIKIDHQDGRKIYFKLNTDYFSLANKITSNYFEDIISMEDSKCISR